MLLTPELSLHLETSFFAYLSPFLHCYNPLGLLGPVSEVPRSPCPAPISLPHNPLFSPPALFPRALDPQEQPPCFCCSHPVTDGWGWGADP